MCRFAVWKGPRRALSALTHDPPNSLLRQSWAPTLMLEAKLNADGAGVAWYPDDGRAEPARYRTVLPLWSDENLASIAPRIEASTAVAIIRSATPGLAVGTPNTPPFVHDELTFAHNGFLESFHMNFMRPVRERLGDLAYATIVGGTDSEHVFALVLELLNGRRDTRALANALTEALAFCARIAADKGLVAALNIVMTNGRGVVASRFCAGGKAPSLFIQRGDGVTIASEPLGGDGWQEVAEGSLVVVSEDGEIEHVALER